MLSERRTYECALFIAAVYVQGLLCCSALSNRPVTKCVRLCGYVVVAWVLLYVFGDPPNPLRHFMLLGVLLHQLTVLSLLLRHPPHRPRFSVTVVAVLQCVLYGAAVGWTVWQRQLPAKPWYFAIAVVGCWWGTARLEKGTVRQYRDASYQSGGDVATPCAPPALSDV